MTLTVDNTGFNYNTAVEQVKQELAEFKVDTNQQFSSIGREIALVLQAIHETRGLIQDVKAILRSLC